MNKTVSLFLVLVSVVMVSGCAQNKTRIAEGAGIGAVLGAATGAIIGHQSGAGVEGALIGGAVGAAGGAAVGSQIEKPQDQEPAAAPAAN